MVTLLLGGDTEVSKLGCIYNCSLSGWAKPKPCSKTLYLWVTFNSLNQATDMSPTLVTTITLQRLRNEDTSL